MRQTKPCRFDLDDLAVLGAQNVHALAAIKHPDRIGRLCGSSATNIRKNETEPFQPVNRIRRYQQSNTFFRVSKSSATICDSECKREYDETNADEHQHLQPLPHCGRDVSIGVEQNRVEDTIILTVRFSQCLCGQHHYPNYLSAWTCRLVKERTCRVLPQ
jgi:hypothetical protein